MNRGRIVKELPPTADNERNSEGSFIRLSTGEIAFAYSRYRGGREDGATCDLAVILSQDEGETFGKERIFLTCEECDAANIMSVSLLPLQSGEIGVFYLKKKDRSCRLYMRKTRDFITLSKEYDCMERDGYFVVNNDRIRRLSDGSILYATAYTPMEVADEYLHLSDWWRYAKIGQAITEFYRSDNDGESFTKIGECKMPYKIFTTGLQEPGFEELADGRLYAYFRNDSGRQFEAYSCDKGRTWTTPAPSRFTSPISPMSTRKLSNGKIMYVYNPAPLYFGRSESPYGTWTGGRTPFVYTFSDLNGDNFEEITAFETADDHGFCYCAIFETKDGILLGYCAGGTGDGSTLARLRIRKLYF